MAKASKSFPRGGALLWGGFAAGLAAAELTGGERLAAMTIAVLLAAIGVAELVLAHPKVRFGLAKRKVNGTIRSISVDPSKARQDDTHWRANVGSAEARIAVFQVDNLVVIHVTSEMVRRPPERKAGHELVSRAREGHHADLPEQAPTRERFYADLLEKNAELDGLASLSLEKDGTVYLTTMRTLDGMTRGNIIDLVKLIAEKSDEWDNELLAKYGHHLAIRDAQME